VAGVGYWRWNNGDQLLRDLVISQVMWGMLSLASELRGPADD